MAEPFGSKWKKYKIYPTMLTQTGNSVDSIKLNTGDSGLKGVQGVTGTQGTQGAPGESASSEFPIGGIIMWSGAIVDIPVNWALCDGEDNRPDLVDKFIVAAGGDYQPGDEGGSRDAVVVSHNHNGITSTAGSHQHRYVDAYYAEVGGDPNRSVAGSDEGADTDNEFFYRTANDGYSRNEPSENDNPLTFTGGEHNHNIDTDGVDGSDANLPPYYALAYIIKIS